MKLNVSQSLEKDFGEGDLVSAQDLATRMDWSGKMYQVKFTPQGEKDLTH